MKITFVQLEALRQIARHKSVTRAARSLGVTQPAVSQHLAALQRAIGIQLVELVGKRPALTEAGRFIAQRAERVGRQIEPMLREIGEYASAEGGTLHIAATLTIGTHVVPKLLSRFRSQHARVVPRIDIINTTTVAERLREGMVSVGLVEGAVDDPNLIVAPFARDRLVLIVPARGHALSDAHSIRAQELSKIAFVSREPGSGTRDHGYDALRDRNIIPPVAIELPNIEAIVRAVEAGLGVAVLSELAVEWAVRQNAVRAVPVDDFQFERNFSSVRLRGRVLAPISQAFVNLVHEGG